VSGLSKPAAYGPTTEMIGAVGLPAPPLAFVVAVAIEPLLIARFQARLVAIALALFALATAMSFHSNFADQNQMIHFLKNIMMARGLLQIAGFGAGAISVDNRLAKDREAAASVVPAADRLQASEPRSRTMIEERDISVAMRDGRRLAVDVYRPDAPGRHPVLYASLCGEVHFRKPNVSKVSIF